MNPFLAFIEGMGGPELMMIMFIILLLFGANKLPELAKGLGKSVREFKKATSGVEDEIRRAMDEPEEPTPKKSPPHPPTADTLQQAPPEKLHRHPVPRDHRSPPKQSAVAERYAFPFPARPCTFPPTP